MPKRKTHHALRLLLALLLVAALPASAESDLRSGEPTDADASPSADSAGIRLDLNRAMALGSGSSRPLDAALDRPVPAPAATAASHAQAAAPAATLALPAAVADSAAMQRERSLEKQAKPKKRGFGRWLKKHWYVPVIVGVAIGVAIGDDDKDDPNEIDD